MNEKNLVKLVQKEFLNIEKTKGCYYKIQKNKYFF